MKMIAQKGDVKMFASESGLAGALMVSGEYVATGPLDFIAGLFAEKAGAA